jgi:hypothetical protein
MQVNWFIVLIVNNLICIKELDNFKNCQIIIQNNKNSFFYIIWIEYQKQKKRNLLLSLLIFFFENLVRNPQNPIQNYIL